MPEGLAFNVQVGGAPDWFTVKELPAIVAVPDRAVGDVFCAQDTVNDRTNPPLVGDTVSHEPLPEAVQLPNTHPLGEPVRETLVEPAAAEGLADVGLIEKLVQVGGAA